MDDIDRIMEEAFKEEVFSVEEDKDKDKHKHKHEDEEVFGVEDKDKDEDKHKHKHEDEEVLGCDSVVLRRSDLDLLRGPHYLNDCIIEFYFCHIKSLFRSKTNSGDILLVSPTISFWLANCQDSESFKDFEESHQVAQKQVVIFTVNDNRNASEIDGGTHWSLLVYYRKPNTFVHYDSLGTLNRSVAKKLYGAVKKHVAAPPTDTSTMHLIVDCVLLKTFNFRGAYGHHKRAKHHNHELMMLMQQQHHHHHSRFNFYSPYNYYSSIDYHRHRLIDDEYDDDHHDHHDHDHDHEYPCYREESRMPRQTNLYDCGLYVMAIAKVICEWYHSPSDDSVSTAAAADDDDHHRQILLRINHDDNQDDLGALAAWFPNITKHLDTSLESTMRAEVLTLIKLLKSSSTTSHPPQAQLSQAQAQDHSQPQAQQSSILAGDGDHLIS